MSPRSSAILWVAPERQAELHPTVISWGFGLGMSAEFDMTGTRDPSPWLAAPDGIVFMRELGLDAMRAWNHQLAWGAACRFTERWGVEIPAPESMYGSMVTIPLPERFGTTPEAASRLKDALLYDEHIETQLHAFKGRLWIRLAAQVYNEAGDYERLFAAIEKRG
jgi:isopenicillin-N epimerase